MKVAHLHVITWLEIVVSTVVLSTTRNTTCQQVSLPTPQLYGNIPTVEVSHDEQLNSALTKVTGHVQDIISRFQTTSNLYQVRTNHRFLSVLTPSIGLAQTECQRDDIFFDQLSSTTAELHRASLMFK